MLLPPAVAGQGKAPVIVAIGDSITAGTTMVDQGSGRSEGSVLSHLGPMLNVSIVNRIMAGDISSNMVARFEEDVMSLRPDHVIIFVARNDLGRSDIAQSRLNHLVMMSDALANGSKVTLVTIAPTRHPEPHHLEMNDWGKNLSITEIMVIDAGALLAEVNGTLAPEYDSGDGINLTAAGYRAIAEEVFLKSFDGTPLRSADEDSFWKDPLAGWTLIGTMGAISAVLYYGNVRFKGRSK